MVNGPSGHSPRISQIQQALMNKKPPTLKRRLPKYLPLLLLVSGLLVFVIGIVVADQQRLADSQAVKQAPSTRRPTGNDFDKYKVAADLPRYMYIPSINVKAIVRSVGQTKTGQVGSPDNVYDTAWFNQSSKPGQAGATLIDGHVSSWSTAGVFYNLKLLKPGQNIVIEKGDGSNITYTVVKTQIYDAASVDMAAVLNPVDPGRPGLNLITCAGSVIKGTNEFDKRIVVFAEMQ